MQVTQVQSLGQEDALEQEMAAHSSILAWEIPWTEEPGRLQVHGVTKNWTYLATEQQQQLFMKASLIQLIFTECMLYSKHCSRHWGHTPNKRDKSLTILDSHVDRESGEDKEDCRVDNKQTFLGVSHAAKKTEKGKRKRIMQENLSGGKVKSSLRKSQRRKKKNLVLFWIWGKNISNKGKGTKFYLRNKGWWIIKLEKRPL